MYNQIIADIVKIDPLFKKLIEEMSGWPPQRLRSLCLDQNDVELVQAILSTRTAT
ncbi:hypothetical protein [uncultured Oscillibacter sp.]|jgi:hypothetical protein|uniref:hypothetical protein n=1 Tax=uncultured Oscillibacter sp. TaxID=876091 RepID=UPI00261D5390|nr:hypothetical protein [uncultured Oscillibacter sp.]